MALNLIRIIVLIRTGEEAPDALRENEMKTHIEDSYLRQGERPQKK